MDHISDFERGMIVAARRVGRSTTETAELLGFPRATVSKVYKEWCEQQKTLTKNQCEQTTPADEESEERTQKEIALKKKK